LGNLHIQLTKKNGVNIRLIGYEIPIENKGKRIDLIGYDEDKNPWIIELKCDDSKEEVIKVVEQLAGYKKILKSHINMICKEFNEKFFIDLELTNNIQLMILAPREFYATPSNSDKSIYPDYEDVKVCSIAKIGKLFLENGEFHLDKIFGKVKVINLKVENK
jgi:hypothetical protein